MKRNSRRLVSKTLILALISSLFSSPMNIYADSVASEQTDLTMDSVALNAVLDEYFLNRELLYTEDNLDFDPDRKQFLKEWENSLSIEICSADVTYNIVDVISTTDTEIKLGVYESVWIEYICDGYEVIEEMGYGTDHIIVLEKENNTYEIVVDSYWEVTDYTAGAVADLQMLYPIAPVQEEVTSSTIIQTPTVDLQYTVNSAYNPLAAIQYSNQWCGVSAGVDKYSPALYNPEYYYYHLADCCNFVSQCVYEGGMPIDSSWTSDSWYVVKNTSGVVTEDVNYSKSSSAWMNTQSFMEYWDKKGYYVTPVNDSSQAIPGNPIFWLKKDGYDYNHNMLIVGKNAAGQILINCHNSNQYRMIIADYATKTYYTIDFAHDFVYTGAGFINATGHTAFCTLCNTHKVISHTYTLDENQEIICGSCGYKP